MTRMDVVEHKSPFVFKPSELPVVMLFPAYNKRPLEFSDAFSVNELDSWTRKHARYFAEDTELFGEEDEESDGQKDEV